MWLFWITIVFSVVYLVFYPGLGRVPGVLGWTSADAAAKESAAVDAKTKPLYDKYLAMDLKQVAADPQARAMGERLFLNNCAQCHGSDAGGSRGFPSLRDSDWLWGGAPETIRESIANGRMGVMPALGPALGEDGTKNVIAYVRSLSGLAHDAPARAARQAAVRAELRGVPWRRRQGQPGGRRAQPDRCDLAVRQLRGDDRRRHQQGPPPRSGRESPADAVPQGEPR